MINWDAMTATETMQAVKDGLRNLTVDQVLSCLNDALTENEMEELTGRLMDEQGMD